MVGSNCQTACPIWNYVAVVMVNTGAGTQTPRAIYTGMPIPTGATKEKLDLLITSLRFTP